MTRNLAMEQPRLADIYDCTACDAQWRYEEVRHTARCPACGGGLTRDAATVLPEGIRELRREISELRRASQQGSSRGPAIVAGRLSSSGRARESVVRCRRSGRRRGLILGACLITSIMAATLSSAFGSADSFSSPTRATLAAMSLRQRIVAIATSQVGYRTEPSNSYCNKFSAYWDAGTASCPSGTRSQAWCADFAAWAWQKAGVRFTYGLGPGDINAGAVSFYEWGVAHGAWHPVSTGYVAAPGDVAVYGLALGTVPSASHVAVVTHDATDHRGPDVINGDGNRTGFSVVETGTDQIQADVSHAGESTLAGYVSAP